MPPGPISEAAGELRFDLRPAPALQVPIHGTLEPVVIAGLGVAIPLMRPIFPSRQLAEMVSLSGCRDPVVAAAGYHEPSLVFLTGTQTLLTDGSGAADFLGQGSCRFALVEQRSERSFVLRAEAIGLRYKVGARIDGYNFSQGRAISISVFRSEGTE